MKPLENFGLRHDPALSPLNSLIAFGASAQHLSFAQAGLELRVAQGAISHQAKGLEEMLGISLFRRLPRGLALTGDGLVLVPMLTEAFEQIGAALDRLEHDQIEEVVTVGCNSTFANKWLLQHLEPGTRSSPDPIRLC